MNLDLIPNNNILNSYKDIMESSGYKIINNRLTLRF